LIATAGGAMASVNSINSLVQTVHALRGIVVPLTMPITSASKVFINGELIDEGIHKKLQQLAQETVRLTHALHPAIAGV
jgi:NAD(P)H-dependent FMN reductase